MTQHTLAVFGDLHGHQWTRKASDRESWLARGVPADPRVNPLAGALSQIRAANAKAKVLVCPGDLGHKANPDGIQLGWEAIQQLATALDARAVAATPGNHDLDSRFIREGYDSKAILLALEPPFPLAGTFKDHFWSNHFVTHVVDDVRLLIVNSAAYHGGNPAEIDHGRIASGTVEAIVASLREGGPAQFNVCVCHHHPQPITTFGADDQESILGGDRLLDVLGSGAYGQWILIHGHRHNPSICYAAGGASSPVVFSAGSFSFKLYPELATRVWNQFYFIDLQSAPTPEVALGGQFQSWDWTYGEGWAPAIGRHLPAQGGFGFRGDLHLLAGTLATAMNEPFADWRTVETLVPDIKYLLPSDLRTVERILGERFNMDILYSSDYRPMQLGRRR